MLRFQEDLFTTLEGYLESPLRDRKRDLYELHTKDFRKIAEFVRDVIALANTTRRYNAPAYLLFGIEDSTQICGLRDQLKPYNYDSMPLAKVWEEVLRKFKDAAENYIEPDVAFQLIPGTIDGKDVAYLLIPPQSNVLPFRVKKQIKARDSTLSVDQCWIRRGESKSEIRLRELLPGDPDWNSWMDRPFLLPSNWMRYLQSLLEIPAVREANEIPGYQDPVVFPKRESLRSQVDAFLEASTQPLLVIQGGAGTGKTSFVQRIVYELADDGLAAFVETINREEFGIPQVWQPLYFRLQGTGIRYQSVDELTSTLLHHANRHGQFWQGGINYPEWLFDNPDTRWLFILDGLDEIWSDTGQRGFLDSLRGFLDRFSLAKVLLTSRPGAIMPDWQSWNAQLVELGPLSEVEIRSYISSVTTSEQADVAIATLLGHDDLWKLCSVPSYLAAAMKELGGQDEPEPRDRPVENISSELGLPAPVQEEETDNTDLETSAPHAILAPIVSIPSVELPRPDEGLSVDSTPTIDAPDDWQRNSSIVEAHQDDRTEPDHVLSPRPGLVVDQMYRYLWRRELHRRGVLGIKAEEWKEQTGDLALATDGSQLIFHRKQIRQFLVDEEAFYWVLSLGVLAQPPSNINLYSFFTELTKAYFAAVTLSVYVKTGDWDSLRQRVVGCKPSFLNQLRQILSDITNQDVSDIL